MRFGEVTCCCCSELGGKRGVEGARACCKEEFHWERPPTRAACSGMALQQWLVWSTYARGKDFLNGWSSFVGPGVQKQISLAGLGGSRRSSEVLGGPRKS